MLAVWVGTQVFKTGRIALGSAVAGVSNPSWNEDLLVVATKPFDPFLTVAVFSGHLVGQARMPLSFVHRCSDDRPEPPSWWLNLCGDEAQPYAGRVHLRLCLEGRYDVLDEAANVASDVRPGDVEAAVQASGGHARGRHPRRMHGASAALPLNSSSSGLPLIFLS
ncbi:hypothetical protein QYE76_016420 [Lolium multiflorum]|uniref:C2 domain-containing protein n=1 Tax=Lolium multiflorum TaxID=4521 RepID=A0AAD8VFI3_LOLMU|nr:hypothetical protein QYE76_016420 [Lolium multiflorum]